MSAIRVGLCLLLVFAVLAFGSVEVWSESIVEIGAALLLCLWAVLALSGAASEIYWTPLNWPILGFLAIGFLQLLFHLTAYAFLTRGELMRVMTGWIVFFLAGQSFRSRSDLRWLAWFFVILCFSVSLFAIAQYFTSGAELYWFRPVVGNVKPFGPYVNRNHFAGFAELTLPIGVALVMLGGSRRDAAPLTILMTLVPFSAVVLSASRAGIICVVVEILTVILFSRIGGRRGRTRLTAIVLVAAAAMALVAWVGYSSALSRFLPQGAIGVSMSRRLSMVRGALGVFMAHPISGSGLGTIIATYPRYETMYDGKVVDHVHNDYAEALAETGLLGAACGLAFFWLLFRQVRANLRAEQGHFSRALHVGATAAVLGLMLHSLVDFNLHIFANALLFLTQVALAVLPPLPSEERRFTERRSRRHAHEQVQPSEA